MIKAEELNAVASLRQVPARLPGWFERKAEFPEDRCERLKGVLGLVRGGVAGLDG